MARTKSLKCEARGHAAIMSEGMQRPRSYQKTRCRPYQQLDKLVSNRFTAYSISPIPQSQFNGPNLCNHTYRAPRWGCSLAFPDQVKKALREFGPKSLSKSQGIRRRPIRFSRHPMHNMPSCPLTVAPLDHVVDPLPFPSRIPSKREADGRPI
jgi:hypothetical protein